MAKDTPYQKGKMDLREHKETYEAFWWWTQWTTVGLIVLLILMAYFLV
jgi:hypothetical protein